MPDEFGRTDAHYAALNNSVDVLTNLLIRGEPLNTADSRGMTPLHLAAQEYSVEAASFLIDNGADINAQDVFLNTPLWTAVFNSKRRGEIVTLLLKAGADPDHINSAGRSPRDLARKISGFPYETYFASTNSESE